MYDWLGEIGYEIADKTVLPLYLWSDPHADLTMRRIAPLREVRTLAFFGRMEERKGIELFLNAILDERLADLPFNVIFVGKEATLTRPQVLEMVGKVRPQLLPIAVRNRSRQRSGAAIAGDAGRLPRDHSLADRQRAVRDLRMRPPENSVPGRGDRRHPRACLAGRPCARAVRAECEGARGPTRRRHRRTVRGGQAQPLEI